MQHPSDVEEVVVFCVEYKTSGDTFLNKLENEPQLEQCRARMQPLLQNYRIHHKVKVYLDDNLVHDTMEKLARDGVDLHRVDHLPDRHGVPPFRHFILNEMKARHVIASSAYMIVVDRVLATIPRVHQNVPVRRGHLHARRQSQTVVVDLANTSGENPEEETSAPPTEIDSDEDESSAPPTGDVTSAPPTDIVDKQASTSCDEALQKPPDNHDWRGLVGSHLDDGIDIDEVWLHRGSIHLKIPMSEALSVATTTQMRERCMHSLQPRKKHKFDIHVQDSQSTAEASSLSQSLPPLDELTLQGSVDPPFEI